MKRYIFLFLVLVGYLASSCSKEADELDAKLVNKKWRAMFITDECKADLLKNDLILAWYGIDDAAGYVVQVKYRNQTFDTPVFTDTLPPDQTRLVVKDLQYGSLFMSRIKVLSKLGPEYDSEWFGEGPGGENEMYLTVRKRYAVPKIINVSYVTTSSLQINLSLSDQTPFLGADGLMYDVIPEVFARASGEFVVDSFAVVPRSGGVPVGRRITQADKDLGYIDVEGLSPNTMYSVDVFNATTPDMRKWDRYYNTINIRTKGGDPVIVHIPWVPNAEDQEAYNRGLCRIDTILMNYYKDAELPEGTIFELDPGQKYYIGNWYNVGTSSWGVMPIEKGFTLRTKENPDGTIAGSGEKARMIHTYGPGNTGAGAYTDMRRGYWQFGRDAQDGELGQLLIGEIIFKNLSCEAGEVTHGYYSSGTTWVGQTPNLYFSCNEGTPMSARVEKWEMNGCDFIGFVSGIFKTKSPTGKVLDSLVVNNCTFYGGGYSANDGGGNSFFRDDSGDWKTAPSTSNMFKNFIFTNNTVWDNPLGHLVDHSTQHTWGQADISWNIVIENNTFVNFAPLATGTKGMYVNLNSPPPGGGKVTMKKNLFVMTQKKIDWAILKKGSSNSKFSLGMYVQDNGDRRLQFDFADNYCTTEHVFRAYPFSDATYGAGAGANPIPGTNPISATDLFTAPDEPDGLDGTFNRPDINNSLKYKNTAAVKASDIYQRAIGDPRWRTSVTP